MAEERKIRLVNLSQRAANLWVRGDRTRLKQVLLNLLSNGVKYNRVKGSLTLECEDLPEGWLALRVNDTGKGIDVDKIDQLFEPFNRLGAEQGTVEGTGIGLSITRRLVELMGGSITVNSVPGEGSSFEIRLPAGKKTRLAGNTTQPLSFSGQGATVAGSTQTLLYIEDNPANLRLVQDLISARPGIQLIFSPQARLGLDLARSHRPTLILMDIHLPGMDGISAFKLLKEDEEIRHIPVIAVSANAMKSDIDRTLNEGFEAYLTKPIQVDQFFSIIDRYFGSEEHSVPRKPSATGATL